MTDGDSWTTIHRLAAPFSRDSKRSALPVRPKITLVHFEVGLLSVDVEIPLDVAGFRRRKEVVEPSWFVGRFPGPVSAGFGACLAHPGIRGIVRPVGVIAGFEDINHLPGVFAHGIATGLCEDDPDQQTCQEDT